MKVAAEKTNTALLANTDLQALVSGKHFWELAPDETKGVYVAYRVLENPAVTKTIKRNFDVTHWCFAPTLTLASDVSELVKTALLNDGQYFRGAESGYVDDETKEGFIKMIFNFNI
jgi:hypothetical protein